MSAVEGRTDMAEKKTKGLERFPTSFSLLKYFTKGSLHYFVFAALFAGLVSFMDLLNPKIIGYVVDTVLQDETSSMPAFFNAFVESIGGREFIRQNLWVTAVCVLIVACFGALFRYLFRISNAKGAETLVKRMRDTLYEQITHLPFSWHGENKTGDIIQRCTSDVDAVKNFLSEQLTSLFRVVVMIILSLFFMSRIHPTLTIFAFLFVPVIVGYSFFFHKRIGKAFRHADEEEGKLSAIAQENLTGVRVVRAFGRESYERERFETQNHSYTNMWIRLMLLMTAFWSSNDFICGAQVLTVTAIGAVFCVRGEMSAGDLVTFISYNSMLSWPVRSLGRMISNLSRASVAIERIRYIMNGEIETEPAVSREADYHQDITFDHVSFTYENGSDEILQDVNFTVKAGTTVGILGGTGSGKSTLMYLLDRLYDLPEGSGRILIGDTDIKDINREELRKHIGMVLQEPYLFSRTLSENIKIASPESGMKEIRNAARLASLDESIERFHEGYETYVGERGVTLSGGQKQRAAIAQMLIRKPPVMIFDDSLSAVDAETDAKIRRALHENTGDATVIIIAHRLTTIMHADDIVVLDQGRVVQEGTHEELLEDTDGIYRKIYDLQMRQE